jgi:hypothetical protein
VLDLLPVLALYRIASSPWWTASFICVVLGRA